MRAATILGLLAVTPAAPAAAQGAESYTVPGTSLAIYNLAGQVTVEPGEGRATVQVTRGGADAARLRVVQGELGGRSTLRVVYPSERIVYAGMGPGSSTDLKVREDGTFGDRRSHGRHHDHDDDDEHDHAEDGRRVLIVGVGEGLAAHADLRIRLPAGFRTEIYLAVGRLSIGNVDGRLVVDAHSAPVSASGIRGSLDIDVGSGPVNVTGAGGSLSVDTGSGPVEVSKFDGSQLSIDTGSGEVTITEAKAEEIEIDTGSGDIRLTGASAPRLSLDTGSGSVTADLRVSPSSLSVDTGSGNIAVTAPPNLGAEVDIETSSGDVETDFQLQVTRHSREHLVGRIGDGRGRISIETGSGDVRLRKAS